MLHNDGSLFEQVVPHVSKDAGIEGYETAVTALRIITAAVFSGKSIFNFVDICINIIYNIYTVVNRW